MRIPFTNIRLVRLPMKPPSGFYGDLAYVHKHEGKVATKGKTGTELHRDTVAMQFRERQIVQSDPNAEHSYTEKIINPTTGDFIVKDEKYIDHKRSLKFKSRKVRKRP